MSDQNSSHYKDPRFGKTIKEARDRAYALCGQVHYAGKKCRSDIAYQALK